MPAFFTGIADLLNGSPLQSAALWTLGNVPGFPPIIQTVHILGIAVVMSSAVLLNLRLLGLAVPSQDIGEMSARVMPWLWTALIVNLLSGAFFVLARPDRYFYNPVFAWKMLLLGLAMLLTILFQYRQRRTPDYWRQTGGKWSGRGLALLSLGAWIMVALAGRWIAYLEHLQYPIWSI